MKNPLRSLRVLLPLIVGASASVPAQELAPLPDKLVSAKSVYLINESGDLKAYDRFFKELKAWNRFAVVTARDQADIIMVLSSKDRGSVSVTSGSATASGNGATGSATSVDVPNSLLQIRVLDPANQEILWTDETEKWMTSGHAPSKLVSNLRKRFPKAPVPKK